MNFGQCQSIYLVLRELSLTINCNEKVILTKYTEIVRNYILMGSKLLYPKSEEILLNSNKKASMKIGLGIHLFSKNGP